MQLFLFHFAGGNCYSYDFLIRKIQEIFITEIDCYALELPGRGERYGESLITNMEEAIADYVDQIKKKRNNQPYIIYGHSMGATLGLSVVKEMEAQYDSPLSFIATGNPGPGITEPDETLKNSNQKKYLLDDDEFKEVLRDLGGVSEEFLTTPELFDFFSPILRADFQLLEEKEDVDDHICVHTPIHAIVGSEEADASQVF